MWPTRVTARSTASSGASRRDLTAGAVVNPASNAPGMSPGSFGAVYAAGVRDEAGIAQADRIPLPTSLGGVSVTVGGVAAPLLAVANVNGVEQVTFQAPFEIAGRSEAPVVVARDGAASAAASVPVVEIQPAVYTIDGVQAIAVHNADFTLVTAARPLLPGEHAFVYATGLGQRDKPARNREPRARYRR